MLLKLDKEYCFRIELVEEEEPTGFCKLSINDFSLPARIVQKQPFRGGFCILEESRSIFTNALCNDKLCLIEFYHIL